MIESSTVGTKSFSCNAIGSTVTWSKNTSSIAEILCSASVLFTVNCLVWTGLTTTLVNSWAKSGVTTCSSALGTTSLTCSRYILVALVALFWFIACPFTMIYAILYYLPWFIQEDRSTIKYSRSISELGILWIIKSNCC